MILSNYNLDTLSKTTAPDFHQSDIFKKFVTVTLDVVIAVPDKSTVDSITVDEPQVFNIIMVRQWPPHLPLFDSIEASLNHVYCQLVQRSSDTYLLVDRMTAEIMKTPIRHVLEIIEGNEHLFRAFKDDLISRSFGLSKIFTQVPDLFRSCIDKFSQTCIDAYCLGKMHPEVWANFALFGEALIASNKFPEVNAKTVLTILQNYASSVNSIPLAVANIIIANFWDFLAFILRNPASTATHLEEWTSGMARVSQLGSFSLVVSNDYIVRKKLEQLMTVFWFVMAMEMESYQIIVDNMRNPAVITALFVPTMPILQETQPTLQVQTAVLDSALAIALIDSNPKMTQEQRLTFLQDVIAGNLRYDPAETSKVQNIPSHIKEKVQHFLSIVFEDFTTVDSRIVPHLKQIPLSFFASNLSVLLDKQNKR